MDNFGSDGYGLWSVAFINAGVIIIFAFSFVRPKTKRDWRSFGAFSAFLVALFAEMYGFPLTIYLLSGWLASRYPGLDLFAHDSGHLWNTLLGIKGDPHFSGIHLFSEALIVAGFILLSASWKVLYQAQRTGQVAMTGPYTHVRHPQYVGFIIIMLGFLFQWPTFLTIIMFPVLVTMYILLARREERESIAFFGDVYTSYAAKTPAFLPALVRINSDQDQP
jgi:protein-S-isoprenylcysteine O-methyltransferase Ste14